MKTTQIEREKPECTHIPITVLIPQCGTVGVNSITTRLFVFETIHWGVDTTMSCSNDMCLCSGSVMLRMRSI
jgi:hypothetical protein